MCNARSRQSFFFFFIFFHIYHGSINNCRLPKKKHRTRSRRWTVCRWSGAEVSKKGSHLGYLVLTTPTSPPIYSTVWVFSCFLPFELYIFIGYLKQFISKFCYIMLQTGSNVKYNMLFSICFDRFNICAV